MNKKLRDRFQSGHDRLDYQQEEAHGEFEKTKAVLQKKVQLFNHYQVGEEITEIERLMLSNKWEWMMAHLLGLIEHEDVINKITDLTKRVYDVEKQQKAIAERLEELR